MLTHGVSTRYMCRVYYKKEVTYPRTTYTNGNTVMHTILTYPGNVARLLVTCTALIYH